MIPNVNIIERPSAKLSDSYVPILPLFAEFLDGSYFETLRVRKVRASDFRARVYSP